MSYISTMYKKAFYRFPTQELTGYTYDSMRAYTLSMRVIIILHSIRLYQQGGRGISLPAYRSTPFRLPLAHLPAAVHLRTTPRDNSS